MFSVFYKAQTTAVGTGAAAPTKNRRASFVAAGVGIVGGQDYRGGQDCRGGNRLMHSPGMLGARLASRLQTQASRSLVTRVRLKGKLDVVVINVHGDFPLYLDLRETPCVIRGYVHGTGISGFLFFEIVLELVLFSKALVCRCRRYCC